MSQLEIRELGKSFVAYSSEWQRIGRWLGIPFKPAREEWVLRRINFIAEPGESIGILGRNGAGKSTLLKLIAGTLSPSEGTLRVEGRAAAILELGMGFNPDMTGRDNAYHAAGLMGFEREEVHKVMHEIQAFADIDVYFDQSVRVYSSGMVARLAFAVATAFRPDVLIVDEVLAVGDAAFQRRCFRRIEDFLQSGTTLLFVSHDTESVKLLCHKALRIDSGELLEFGPARQVCEAYEKDLFANEVGDPPEQTRLNEADAEILGDPELVSDCEVVYGDGRAHIEKVWLENGDGKATNVFLPNRPFKVKYNVRADQELVDPIFAFMVKTKEGSTVFGTDSKTLSRPSGSLAAGEELEVVFRIENNLAPGTYFLNCGIRDSLGDETSYIHRRVDTMMFKVLRNDQSTAAVGVAEVNASIELTR